MRAFTYLVIVLAVVGLVGLTPRQYEAMQLAREDFAEAEQRIDATIEASKTVLDLSGLAYLRTVPESILKLPDLWFLDLTDTEISSLATIAQLPLLEHLTLRNTRVEDLSPLAEHKSLRNLNIGNSLVRDLEPLTRTKSLERLDIGNLEIQSLEPTTRIRSLLWINLHRAYAWDGSRVHYDQLYQTVPEVYNGSAFKQNYTPAPLYLRKTQLNRLADTLYLPQPFPRP